MSLEERVTTAAREVASKVGALSISVTANNNFSQPDYKPHQWEVEIGETSITIDTLNMLRNYGSTDIESIQKEIMAALELKKEAATR